MMSGGRVGAPTVANRRNDAALAGTSRDRVVEQYRSHVNLGLAKLASLSGAMVEVRSEGSLIFDADGQAYLNCGGYGVFVLGSRHPAILAALRSQLEYHALASKVLLSGELAAASEALANAAPDGLEYVTFANSGAEAVELGIKLARLSGKRKIIAMERGFHGKTMAALSATGNARYRNPFSPLLPDVTFVPYGDVDALRVALAEAGDDCCVILEPVQGEGGVRIPPSGYLRLVKQACDAHGAFLIFDEIQTGLGRLGAWWGADREGVTPDVLLVGKALGGGVLPVAAAVSSAEAYAPLNADPFLHTSTFAGNPLAATAALATIRTIREEAIVPRAAVLGDRILQSVTKILTGHEGLVAETRGVGLLIGIEFRRGHFAADFMTELLVRRVIVSHSLNSDSVVRLTPPAILTDDQVDWLCTAVAASADVLEKRYRDHL
jgi:putrescine aminotransferase